MIDRARPLLPLSYAWYKYSALAASSALALPVTLALTSGIVAMLICGLLWVFITLGYLLGYLLAFLPLLAAFGGAAAIVRRLTRYRRFADVATPAVTAVVLLAALGALVTWPTGWWALMTAMPEPVHAALAAWAGWTWDFGRDLAGTLRGSFVEYQLYWASVGIVATAVGTTVIGAALIGVARLRNLCERWLFKRAIQCPRCRHAEPLVGCPREGCDALHDDLAPSRHGIWSARCAKCGASAPTLKSKQQTLKKTCRGCKSDLSHPDLGRLPEFHLAVVGAKNSGKSLLVTAAVAFLERSFAPMHQLTVTFASAAETEQYRKGVANLLAGQVVGQTARAERPFALTFSIRDPASNVGCLVYLYDAAGEDIQAGSAVGDGVSGHDFHSFIDGLILVVDPFAEEGLQRAIAKELPDGLPPGLNPAPHDAHYVLSRMIPFWGRTQHVSSHGQFEFPIAVVLTKMDACGLASRVNGYVELDCVCATFGAAAMAAESRSDDIRSLLHAAASVDLLRLIDSHFRQARYFGVSSLGRVADRVNKGPFQSRGAFAPLAWLLDRAGAMSPAHPVLQGLRFFRRQCVRCLRGAEGVGAQCVALASVATVAVALLLVVWWQLGGWSASAAAVALLASWFYVTNR